MISCDTNILFYSLNSECAEYPGARSFLKAHSEDGNFAVCELVLVELYVLLRNPKMNKSPATAEQAVSVVRQFRSNPCWRVIDYPGGLMNEIWKHAEKKDFSYRSIFDARLALTLMNHGVKDFATRNVKDFESYGFNKVWDPLTE